MIFLVFIWSPWSSLHSGVGATDPSDLPEGVYLPGSPSPSLAWESLAGSEGMGALCEDLQEFHEGGVAALRMSPQMEVTLDS